MVITSLENDKVKELVKLQKKKYRDLTGTFLVEGEHLVEEVFKSGLVINVICLEDYNCNYDIPVMYVSYDVMKKISSLDTPPAIMALCRKKDDSIIGNRIVILDNIQDPGNLGTIIRSSVSFNVDTIVLSPNSVDLYNPKVLRSTQGMFCHINIVYADIIETINMLHEKDFIVYGTNVVDGVDVRRVSPSKYWALVMGNEGSGVSSEILDLCDNNLYIKMNSKVESLNVSIACSILLYELGRLDG
ncbi:MAG: RNA methyltransferase [Bacilli bacterium]|nr:RNA methyltransferase [Bacilli bacterium]